MRCGFAPLALLPFVTVALIGLFLLAFVRTPAVASSLSEDIASLLARGDFAEGHALWLIGIAGEKALAESDQRLFSSVFMEHAERYRLEGTYATSLFRLVREQAYTIELNVTGSFLVLPGVIVSVSESSHHLTRTFTVIAQYTPEGTLVRVSRSEYL
jgi:hypothetical protein